MVVPCSGLRRWSPCTPATMVAVLLMMVVATGVSASSGEREPVSLDEAIGRAMAESPALVAADADAAAAREAVRARGGWPDPRVSVGIALEPVETRLGPQETRIGITQPLPLFASPGLRAEVSRGMADQRAAAADVAARRVMVDVTRAYADLAYLERATEVTRTTASLLADVEAVVRSRYEAGRTGAGAVIRAEVEAARMADRADGLADRADGVRARLEAAMGEEVRGRITTTGLPDPAPVPDAVELRSRLRDVNPQLRALDGAVRGAEAASRLASRGRWPQLSVGVDWIGIGEPDGISPADAGRDAWMAMAMVEIPLFFGARDGAYDEARATRTAREADRADRLLALTAALEAAVAGARELERRVVLFEETLLPRAEEAVVATTDAFTAGGASLTDVVDVHRVRLDLVLDLARSRADLLVRRAEIASLAGPDPRAASEEVSR